MATEHPVLKRIAFLLYSGLTAFDLTGPLQVLTALSVLAAEYEPVVVPSALRRTKPTSR